MSDLTDRMRAASKEARVARDEGLDRTHVRVIALREEWTHV